MGKRLGVARPLWVKITQTTETHTRLHSMRPPTFDKNLPSLPDRDRSRTPKARTTHRILHWLQLPLGCGHATVMHLPPGHLHFLRCKKTRPLKGVPCSRIESRFILKWILSSVSLNALAIKLRTSHEHTVGDGADLAQSLSVDMLQVEEFSLDNARCELSYLSMTSLTGRSVAL